MRLWRMLFTAALLGPLLAQPAFAVLEWSDVSYLEGQYSRIYFDFISHGSSGTFYCMNDWMTNQDDGGVDGGLLPTEYNRFNFTLSGSDYEVRIFPDGTGQVYKDGTVNNGSLWNFNSATSWSSSPNLPVEHAQWEWSFDIAYETTTITKFVGCDPPGPTTIVVPNPPALPPVLQSGPSEFAHFVDGEFADQLQPSVLAPVPSREPQLAERDPWFDQSDDGSWDITLLSGGGVKVVTPEPASLTLLIFGGGALLARRRR